MITDFLDAGGEINCVLELCFSPEDSELELITIFYYSMLSSEKKENYLIEYAI